VVPTDFETRVGREMFREIMAAVVKPATS
jgi:hypothetical protein